MRRRLDGARPLEMLEFRVNVSRFHLLDVPMPKLAPADKHLQRGAATTLVLLVLKDSPSYGYQIVQEIRARSAEAFDFPEGTIYPILYGLESEGAIKGEWKPGIGDRKRKVYRLTPQGRKELERRVEAWQKYASGMRVALKGT